MADIFTMSFSGVVMAFCALALGFFSLWRYRHYKANPANSVNYYYWTASALVTFGFTLYLIPGFIEVSWISDAIIILAIAATVINVAGFGYFFLIPIYSWLSKEMFVLGSHIIGFCVFGIAAMLAITPPAPILMDGIIHWRFAGLAALTILTFMGAAFLTNVLLLLQHFKRLSELSHLNVVALLGTFLLTGFGGGYLYAGDNHEILRIAYASLGVGIFFVFWSALKNFFGAKIR